MYDARGGGNANNGSVFAIALCSVVAAAFAAVAFWPSGSGAGAADKAVAERSVTAAELFPGREEQKFAQALKTIDEAAYLDLEKRFRTKDFTDAERHNILMDVAEAAALEHIDALAKSDVKHMDVLLGEIIAGLQTASRSRAKLCRGSTYAALDGMSELQMGAFMEREIISHPEVQEFAVKLNRRMLEAAMDGHKNPKRYGKLNAKDKRALDGIGMQLMTDPKIMRVLMAASTSSNPETVLASLDVCDLSVSVLRIVDRLPEETKARLWASTFAEIKKNGSFNFDPSGLTQLGGF